MSLEYSDGSEPRLGIDPSDASPFFMESSQLRFIILKRGPSLTFDMGPKNLVWLGLIFFGLDPLLLG